MKTAIRGWLSGKGYGFNGEAFLSLEKTTRPLISELIEGCMADIGPKWVSVDVEMPEPFQGHIVLGYGAGYAFECECDAGFWGNIGGEEMTHWMKMPEEPAQ